MDDRMKNLNILKFLGKYPNLKTSKQNNRTQYNLKYGDQSGNDHYLDQDVNE